MCHMASSIRHFYNWPSAVPIFPNCSLLYHGQVFFLVVNFYHFVKKLWNMNILSQIHYFWFFKKVAKIPTIYNMKVQIRFFIFISRISPNLAKYTYWWLQLEQHHKIEKETQIMARVLLGIFLWSLSMQSSIGRCKKMKIIHRKMLKNLTFIPKKI